MKYIKPSWFIQTKLNQEANLFSISNIETNYLAYTYFCHCGRVEKIIDTSQKPYKCKCGNNTFLDTSLALKDFKSFVENLYYKEKIKIDFELYYKIDILDNKVQAICYIKIPIEMSENKKECKYTDIVIASAVPNNINKIEKIGKEYDKTITLKLKSILECRDEFEKYIDIKLSRRGSKTREKQIYFFLNHYNLKDIEFFNWKNGDLLKDKDLTIQEALIDLANDKNYKSVKKAIFGSYINQINDTKLFNPLLIYVATSKFSNPNFIVSIIELNNINTDKYLSTLDRDILLEFFDFLITIYTQKQVCYFLRHFDNFIKLDKNNLNKANKVFQDILNQYKIIKSDLKKEFQKVRCTPRGIHDEFVRILNKMKYKHLQNITLKYKEEQYKALVKIDEYEIKLPNNGAELYDWADTLHNCMASYLEVISLGYTTIYGFFKNHNIEFAVEIKNNTIIQAYRSYNRGLFPEQSVLLNDWFGSVYSNVKRE